MQVINGIPETEGWRARERWNLTDLKELYGKKEFKIGEDDDGKRIKVELKHFLKYLKHNLDDSPLYLFDGSFDSGDTSLLKDYQVPSFFPDDLFELVGEERRPPYRWFLIGPARSGTTVHIDPLGTSAWNTVISGRKRWVLFPPEVSKQEAKGIDVRKKGEDDEAINYFVDFIPRMRSTPSPSSLSGEGVRSLRSTKMIEFTQFPGETVFIPGGWWHGAINLDDTIAITQVAILFSILYHCFS